MLYHIKAFMNIRLVGAGWWWCGFCTGRRVGTQSISLFCTYNITPTTTAWLSASWTACTLHIDMHRQPITTHLPIAGGHLHNNWTVELKLIQVRRGRQKEAKVPIHTLYSYSTFSISIYRPACHQARTENMRLGAVDGHGSCLPQSFHRNFNGQESLDVRH